MNDYDYLDPDDLEPDFSDDRVLACPECETPNQFGEICLRCERELREEADRQGLHV